MTSHHQRGTDRDPDPRRWGRWHYTQNWWRPRYHKMGVGGGDIIPQTDGDPDPRRWWEVTLYPKLMETQIPRDGGWGGGGHYTPNWWKPTSQEMGGGDIIPNSTLPPPNDTCIKMGSDESHFIVLFPGRSKGTRPCPQTTTFEEKEEQQ